MDLDDSIQRPLHWGHIILPDAEDRAFLDAVVGLAQFIVTGQLIQVFPMPAILEMLFQLVNVLSSEESVEWTVPEISLSQAH